MTSTTLETINIASFRSVALAARKQFPLTACIYFCLNEKGVVRYIEQTGNSNQAFKLMSPSNGIETFYKRLLVL